MSGPRLLVVQHTEGEHACRLGDWLTDAGARLHTVRPYVGEDVPPTPAGYDELLVLGGPQEAYDDEDGRPAAPWLPAVKELMRAAVHGEVPTLGVCLGGQLLAEAMGGRVQRASDGPEIGGRLVAKRDAAGKDPLFADVPFTPDVLQWHVDEIVTLPPGAVLLASSPMYAHQAFRVGARAWGLQFHIETDADMVKTWAEETRSDLTAAGLDVDRALATAIAIQPDLEATWRPFAERFVALAGDG